MPPLWFLPYNLARGAVAPTASNMDLPASREGPVDSLVAWSTNSTRRRGLPKPLIGCYDRLGVESKCSPN
jgi:hypothetical protein